MQKMMKKQINSRVARIQAMEERYDHVLAALDEFERAEARLAGLSDEIAALREYYESGKWQKDFEADEAGLVPRDLPREVLSEDALYNLLAEADEILAPAMVS